MPKTIQNPHFNSLTRPCVTAYPPPLFPFPSPKFQKSWTTTSHGSKQHGPSTRNLRLLKLVSKNSGGEPQSVLGLEENNSYGELRFKDEQRKKDFKLESSMVDNDDKAITESSHGLGILELNDEKKIAEEEDLVRVEDDGKIVEGSKKRINGSRRGRQVIKRSNLLAKQVISIQSALSLGFVSQIWVDTAAWVVMVVEVRQNLLSGESERFLLEDITQIGDVVLVEDENVLENDLKMLGLDTLVGYKVMTPGRRNIGKVRGYSFNINTGVMESLELDSFGISIIPSSLVSTYALPVEDVLEVLSDTVVVHESAGLHIQRLTKGIWDAQNVGAKVDELGEFDYESSAVPRRDRSTRKSSSSQKPRPKIKDIEDDWELPIDYL